MACVAGMCGFSMGGVHASMVASLYPGNVACTPLLAPRSASGAFCHGALRSATSWEPLAAVVDEKQKVSALPTVFHSFMLAIHWESSITHQEKLQLSVCIAMIALRSRVPCSTSSFVTEHKSNTVLAPQACHLLAFCKYRAQCVSLLQARVCRRLRQR